MISLWETDAVLQQGAQQRVLETGRQRSSSDTQGPGLAPFVARYEEIYVKAYGATLLVPWNSTMQLYVDDAVVVGAASLQLTQASGSLETPSATVSVDDEDVYLQGVLASKFAGDGTGLPLRADISGDVASARVGSTQLGLDSAAQPGISGPISIVSGAVLVACVVLAALAIRRQHNLHRAGMALAPTLPRRQRNAIVLWHAAADCLDRQRWHQALRFATRARRADPASVDAQYAWAVAQHKLARPARALAMYQQIHPKLERGQPRAENAAAISLALVELGRADEALPWLRASFADDPAVAQAWGRNRAFDALDRNPWLRSLRSQPSTDPAFG